MRGTSGCRTAQPRSAVVVEVAAVRARRRRAFEQLRMSAEPRAALGVAARTQRGASMKARHRRFAWIGAGLLALGVAAALVLNAFQSNLVFFFTPSQVVAKEAPQSRPFRIGGLVEAGSLKRDPNSLTVQLSRDRHRADDSRSSTPACCPTSSRRARASSRRGRSGPTGRSTRPKCSRSTTRTTCRPRRRTRSTRRTGTRRCRCRACEETRR